MSGSLCPHTHPDCAVSGLSRDWTKKESEGSLPHLLSATPPLWPPVPGTAPSRSLPACVFSTPTPTPFLKPPLPQGLAVYWQNQSTEPRRRVPSLGPTST